ncbi:nitrogenase molybdenum-iron protein alpha chain [Propionispira arboris]|uniref:Nitrogenase molybdenum-iron protein alpha chain n=1 Tax=Propionispira arboris TaxID=84035 RepID=A0A1H7ATM0_9FIRM|nr:nitrogenase component 1 [Propionispira arboris]SEJ67217.1 nitrogenase molybdenum-iron protein alpha chain [Propionispira arboris]
MGEIYSGIRESRPHTFNDLGDTSQNLEQDFNKGCLKKADRSFAQGLQCQQINSMAALMSLDDAVFIAHSPQGCIGCTTMATDVFRVGQAHRGVKLIKNPRIIVSNIDQNDVVFGGEKKLQEAITYAGERYDPKLIFIFTSCASGIIGDDVDAVIRDLQQTNKALLIPIHCEGFKSKVCASGFDAAFISITKYILNKEKIEKIPNLINLFAPTTVSYKDQLEIERMLATLGVEANYIPFYSSLEKIKKIPAAVASTSICKVFADEFMQELADVYDIPFSHTVMPIGVRNTDKWFRGIAKIVGKASEAEAIIEQEHARVLPEIEKIRKRLQGKKVFICGGTGRSFAAAALLEDFGMELVGLETPTYDVDAQLDIEYLNGIHKNFVVDIANMQPFEQINLVKRLKPDVFIGVPTWAARLGIPTTHVLDMKRPTMGYDGILYLGNKIADQVDNPGFNVKLAKHARLPYRESWYTENPFKYIEG